jgi:AraC-like DNA-binding protein
MARVSRLRSINVDRTRMPVRRRIRSRGVPNALQGHPVACTADMAEATEVATDLLGSLAISPVPVARTGFLCTLHAVQCLDTTLAHLDFAAPVDLTVWSSGDCYTVHLPTSGQGRVSIAGAEYQVSAFSALVVSPGSAYRLRLDQDSPQLVVRVERPALERVLSRMIGRSLRDPVRFEPIGDLTSSAAARWSGALNILFAEVLDPGSLIQRGVGAAALEDLLVSSLLYVQPSNYSAQLTGEPRRSGRAAVRRSLEYIEAHLAEPIALADLAAHSGMSARSIQAGFREDLDTTPVAYIRDQRLDRVRRTLMAAVPEDGLSVTEVAERWGFHHLGNFSALYRRRFGEPPSETLRR